MDKVKTLLQRLKPLYSSTDQAKLDQLWILFQASDWERKKEIEETVSKIAARHGLDTVDEKIVLPPPADNHAGDISIGKVTYLGKQLYDYKIKLSELTRHAGIFGSTGTGKTTLARHIVRSLMAKGIPFVIFDWESSYRGLIKDFPDIKLYTIGKDTAPFRFNFFKVPPGIDYKEYVKNVIEVFNKAYVGGVGSDTILKRVFDAAYAVNRLPTLAEVKAVLDSAMKGKHNMRGREMLWKQSALRMIEFMLYGQTGDMYNVENTQDMESLFGQPVIFELGGLANSNDKRFFTEILTLWYTLNLEHRGIEDEHLKHVLLFEEFHNIVENSKKEDFIHRAFRQLRKYGTGLIALDQTPSQIPNSIFENMGTKITFSLDHVANVKAIAGAMFMEKEQAAYIGLLKTGEAIVRSKQRHPLPFLVTVPFDGNPAHVPDEAVNRHMAPFCMLSASSSVAEDPCPALHIPPGYEYTPTAGELILLQAISREPFLGTDERYKRLGLSARQGTKLKNALMDHGYLQPVNIDRKVLFELPQKARDFLKLKKIPVPPQARGGIEHNYWLEQIKMHFTQKGDFPFKEKDDIDLVVEGFDYTILIQVETGKSNIKKNIETLLRANGDRRFMIATNKSAELKIRSIMAESNLPGQNRVEIYHVNDFLTTSPISRSHPRAAHGSNHSG